MMNRRRLLRVSSISMILVGIFVMVCSFPIVLLAPEQDYTGGLVPRNAADSPIVVDNDTDWADVPNIEGDGSPGNPYVIKDKVIDVGGTGSGILIGNTTAHFVIQNCTVFNCEAYPYAAIHIVNASNGMVIGNNCSNNAGTGVLLENNCSHFMINNNQLKGNGYGVVVYNVAFNITLENNNATDSIGGPGIALSRGATNITIVDNNASVNNFAGISLWNAVNVSIQDNIINSNTNYGIRLLESNKTSARNNTVTSNPDGIYLETGATMNEFVSNNITGNTDAVHFTGGNHTLFEDNTISGNTYGIHWMQGNNNTILRNNITGTSLYSIFFDSSGHNNSILWNNISNNQHGIYCFSGADMARNNTIAFNSFIGNTGFATRLETNNNGWFFYGNNFSSTTNALDAGSWNRWDNGSVGNFWSTYAAADANDDFIGDVAYTVPAMGAQDHYPFRDDGDDVAPVVTITGLTTNQLCGGAAPSYGLTIAEAYIVEDTWVSYDAGINNHTCLVSGSLPDWGDAGNGTVTITFYANDTGNHVGAASISIRKDIEAPTFTSTGFTAGQLFGNSTPGFVLAASEGNPTGLWWFSFDSGITNITCSQSDFLVGWDSSPNGTVTVRFYTNDTLGNVGWADVSLQRDCAPPVISSTGLTAGASFTSAPTLSLVIAEANRHVVWYSVDDGATNHTLASLTSSLDAAVWAALPIGNVIITIWANDTLGNTASILVVVVKASPRSECEGCGDPTLYYVIGGIIAIGAVVGIVVIVKKRKNRGFYPDEVPASK